MRQRDSLKSYISFFQSQLVKLPYCSDDVFALAFISGLQVSHPMYKHLLKQNVTQMGEVMSSALHPAEGSNENFLQLYRKTW